MTTGHSPKKLFSIRSLEHLCSNADELRIDGVVQGQRVERQKIPVRIHSAGEKFLHCREMNQLPARQLAGPAQEIASVGYAAVVLPADRELRSVGVTEQPLALGIPAADTTQEVLRAGVPNVKAGQWASDSLEVVIAA